MLLVCFKGKCFLFFVLVLLLAMNTNTVVYDAAHLTAATKHIFGHPLLA